MTTAALSLKAHRNLQAKTDSVSLPFVNWKIICVIGFLFSLALLVFYVYQINSLTRGFYLVNSYQKQISKLNQDNKNLEVSFAESSFLGQALEKIQAMNFEKTSPLSTQYIKVPDNSVATTVQVR